MTAQIIDGDKVAAEMIEKLKQEVESLKSHGITPCLHSVQANDNPGSRIYIKNQAKACEQVGIEYVVEELSPEASEKEIADCIIKLNEDADVHGIILQMPLPKGVNSQYLYDLILPTKDCEGITKANLGQVVYGDLRIAPCTAMASFELLKSLPLKPQKEVTPNEKKMAEAGKFIEMFFGHNACVVGSSDIVGKPVSLILTNNFCTVSTCHIGTQDLASYTKNADILVCAAGVPNLIKADMVKPGAAVIDVAINRVPMLDENGEPVLSQKTGRPRTKIVGDCDFENVKEVAGYITPVPGGVGPVTTAFLLKNTLECSKILNDEK